MTLSRGFNYLRLFFVDRPDGSNPFFRGSNLVRPQSTAEDAFAAPSRDQETSVSPLAPDRRESSLPNPAPKRQLRQLVSSFQASAIAVVVAS